MKMRFKIDYTVPSGIGAFMERDFVMKYISYVIMDGAKHKKPKIDSEEVQSFYYFLSNNRMKVTELKMENGTHVFLKNGEYHSYDTYCYNQPNFKITYYAKNGKVLSPEETMFFERELKMRKLKEKIIK